MMYFIDNIPNYILTNNWYSKHLFAMREPILYDKKFDAKIYRFTWLRTFNYPITIRLELQEDECFLHWKVCNGAGGYEAGKLITDRRKKIDPKFWELFEQRVIKLDFWNLSTNQNTFGLDGAKWVLEAKTKDQYHVVHRWSPDEESQFYQVCNYLIELTSLKVKDRNKY
ncbi:MAG: hypothetical protein AAF806_11825 [Bacteroidota bacterium]